VPPKNTEAEPKKTLFLFIKKKRVLGEFLFGLSIILP